MESERKEAVENLQQKVSRDCESKIKESTKALRKEVDDQLYEHKQALLTQLQEELASEMKLSVA